MRTTSRQTDLLTWQPAVLHRRADILAHSRTDQDLHLMLLPSAFPIPTLLPTVLRGLSYRHNEHELVGGTRHHPVQAHIIQLGGLERRLPGAGTLRELECTILDH